MIDPKLVDQAKLILQDAPISNEQKIALWDDYHDSPTAESLARKLDLAPIPDDLKRALFAAKQKSLAPESTTPVVDKAVEAFARLPKNVLDISERHQVIVKLLVDAHLKS
jgi:hypothetical protein